MSARVVASYRVPAAGPGACIEVEVVEHPRPGRWRLRLALLFVRLAGRLARMRVRVTRDMPVLP